MSEDDPQNPREWWQNVPEAQRPGVRMLARLSMVAAILALLAVAFGAISQVMAPAP